MKDWVWYPVASYPPNNWEGATEKIKSLLMNHQEILVEKNTEGWVNLYFKYFVGETVELNEKPIEHQVWGVNK